MLSRGRVALIFSIAVIDCMNAADVKLGRLARISITMHLKKILGMNARWASHENVNASPLLRSTARSASAFPAAAMLMSQALVLTGLQRAAGWARAIKAMNILEAPLRLVRPQDQRDSRPEPAFRANSSGRAVATERRRFSPWQHHGRRCRAGRLPNKTRRELVPERMDHGH